MGHNSHGPDKIMRDVVSQRVQSISPSGIRRFFELVMGRPDVVSLGVGEPDFATPWHIREAAIYSIERGYTCYTSNYGTFELRDELAKFIQGHYGGTYDPKSEILVTTGVSEGADVAFRAVLDPGDEVLVPEPTFVCYTPMIELAGGKAVFVPTRDQDKFAVQVEALEKAVTPNTRAIILNYPNNPTGGRLTKTDVEKIADFCVKHNLIVLSDEIYSLLTYEGEHTSFASVPELRERLILMGGFSKAWAMTGWRVGFLAAPQKIVDAMMKIHQYVMMCAPIMAQMAALEALKGGDAAREEMKDSYNLRRRLMVKGFNDMGLRCFMPGGAFYAFPSIASTGLTSEEFSVKLLEEESVAVVPGNVFGPSGEGHVRCCYAASQENITEALHRIGRFVRNHAPAAAESAGK